MWQALHDLSDSRNFVNALMAHKIDLAFGAFMLILTLHYVIYILPIQVPIWDGAVYLENAKNWLEGEPLYRAFRPQLFSWIISGIWSITGENWLIIKYLQVSFTLGAGIVLYLTLRKYKGGLFAIGVVSLTMLNAQVFYFSVQMLTEGISLFFLVLALYFLKGKNAKHWPLGGVSIGLTFASRYPIILQALVIMVVESLIRSNPRIFMRAMIGAIPVISIVVLVLFLKTGTFEVALEQDTGVSVLLSPFYIMRAIPIWSFAILLVPVAFLFRKTYTDKYNYTFIAWFLVSLVFWSANASNHQERFAIQYAPAVYFLAILAVENIVKSKPIFQRAREHKTLQTGLEISSSPGSARSQTAIAPLGQEEMKQLKASVSAIVEGLHMEGITEAYKPIRIGALQLPAVSIADELLHMEATQEEYKPIRIGALQLPAVSIADVTQFQSSTTNSPPRRIPMPQMPGYYRKEGEPENIIYQEGFED